MSISSRLDRLDKALPDGDVCVFCGRRHARSLADLVRAHHEGGAVCGCSMCSVCAWMGGLGEMVKEYEKGREYEHK